MIFAVFAIILSAIFLSVPAMVWWLEFIKKRENR